MYAAGLTASTDFPTTPGALQHEGFQDGFVFKLGNDAPIVPQMQFATSARG